MTIVYISNVPDEELDSIDRLADWHDDHPNGVEEVEVDDNIA